MALNDQLPDVVTLLRAQARDRASRTAYVFLDDGETESARLSYRDLDRCAQAVAARLQHADLRGQRALLLYPPGMDYIIAFFGCLYAGVVAVPAYPPSRHRLARLRGVVRDAAPSVVMSTAALRAKLSGQSQQAWEGNPPIWLTTDAADLSAADDWVAPEIDPQRLAFLQYTSGSTGDPKGVMVSHANLLANQQAIKDSFRHTEDSTVVGWLPLYHDMGLIGNLLQPLYLGSTAILMPPLAFVENPVRWLRAISHYRACTSGGPNFGYELCARKVTAEQTRELDLTCWTVAFNGSEPVRATTLERFAAAFAECGFRQDAFLPCYGLAEATLFVAGSERGNALVCRPAGEERLRAVAGVDGGTANEGFACLVGCGRAWNGHEVIIVDPETAIPCEPGGIGEIWVSGPSVALGYWSQPEATQTTFRAHPAGGSERSFLRTGDLGFIERGELFIAGRLKDLIIIRGRNYHPEDLERALDEHAQGLRPGYSAAFSVTEEDEETLVVVAEVGRDTLRSHGADPILASMRRALAEACEVPLATLVLVQRGSVPKTSSGKVRRQACKQDYLAGRLPIVACIDAEVQANGATEHPGTDLNSQLRDSLDLLPSLRRAELLTQFLIAKAAELAHLPETQLTSDRSLRAIGLDSLRVVELKHALERLLGGDVPIALLVSDRTVAELADELAGQISAAGGRVEERGRQEAVGPLSHAQRLIWTVHQLDPDSIAYNLHLAFRLHGALDPALFRRAWEHLRTRHAILRTTYTATPAGVIQTVLPLAAVPDHLSWIEAAEWSGSRVQQDLAQRAQQPFDLTRGPVVRITGYRHAEGAHTLLFCAHHIAVDLWSLMVLMTELRTVYEAVATGRDPKLAEIGSGYQDFVDWQEGYLASPAGVSDWEYWRERLRGPLPLLALPTDHARPPQPHYSGRSQSLHLGSALTARLKGLAEQHGVTLFILLLAAYKVLLYRYTHQREIIVGAPSSGRSQGRFATVVGNFVNPIALRTRPSPHLPFSTFLQEVREAVLGALAHQDFPFPVLIERLQPERHVDHWPLYQTWFVLQQAQSGVEQELAQLSLGEDGAAFAWGEWTIEPVGLHQRVENFDLKVMAAEQRDGLLLSLQYRPDLFKPATLARLGGHFRTLIEGLVTAPEQRLSDLPLLPEDERRRIIEGWNATGVEYPGEGYLPGLWVR
ncbi:MAG: condensation domain-containing protein, partial [Gammaproteobacteria bacterium]